MKTTMPFKVAQQLQKKIKPLKGGKWHLVFVEDSTPVIKAFKTQKQMQAFVDDFKVKDGYWIDYAFKGELRYNWISYSV